MQIGDINYEKKYAFAEVEIIIDFLGENYKSKIPKEILRYIKNEKKFDYKPNFDFTKPLPPQVTRQETKDIIAFLYCNYWCDNEKDKEEILEKIKENAEKKKEQDRLKRQEEIKRKANNHVQSLDDALKNRLK